MKPNLSFHRITSMDLSRVEVFPKSPDTKGFCSRFLVLSDAAGDSFQIGLFSEAPGELELPIERGDPTLLELCELVDALDALTDPEGAICGLCEGPEKTALEARLRGARKYLGRVPAAT